MCHEQLAVDQVDIGFNTAKTVVERVEQGVRVGVIVVGVNAGERGGSRLGVNACGTQERRRIRAKARKHGCKLQATRCGLLATYRDLGPATFNLQPIHSDLGRFLYFW
jgi:hypothetical protein